MVFQDFLQILPSEVHEVPLFLCVFTVFVENA